MVSNCPRMVSSKITKSTAIFNILIWRFLVTALQILEYHYNSISYHVTFAVTAHNACNSLCHTPKIPRAYKNIYILFRCLNSLFLI